MTARQYDHRQPVELMNPWIPQNTERLVPTNKFISREPGFTPAAIDRQRMQEANDIWQAQQTQNENDLPMLERVKGTQEKIDAIHNTEGIDFQERTRLLEELFNKVLGIKPKSP